MSANLVVDLNATTDYRPTVACSDSASPSSGTFVGKIVDLLHANTFCNIYVEGGPGSGAFQVQVQTSDGTTSGSFTDPTSGLAQLPTYFVSGGGIWVNSGLWSSGNQSLSTDIDQAPLFCSGGAQAAAFQRLGRYARAIVLSGQFSSPVAVSFISQKKTTGSGGGFSLLPGSGSVNV